MSSLIGALNTAVSGLSSQSAAFGNISDNVANSQSTGFKRTDTSFVDYLTNSTKVENESGFVQARPEYQNDVQGSIASSQNTLAMAISGKGFFQVTDRSGTGLSANVEYSRNGDVSLDKNGYLVNSTGQVMDGWTADATTGVLNKSQIVPIKVDQSAFNPVATTKLTLQANLPATPGGTTPYTSSVNIYDAKGTMHNVTLSWSQNATDDWTVSLSSPDTAGTIGTAEVKFGATSGNSVAAGTVGSVANTTGGVTGSTYSAGGDAALNFTADLGGGSQTIALDLGTYGVASGLTQFAGTNYTVRGTTQNGMAPGSFSGVTTQSSGDVVANYDNGETRVVARIPVVQFANSDALQRQNGQAFTQTFESGPATAQDAGVAGAGTIVTSSVEGSNVDIATEFTKLIVAQRAYSANTKMVTTADDMLQQTIDMKR